VADRRPKQGDAVDLVRGEPDQFGHPVEGLGRLLQLLQRGLQVRVVDQVGHLEGDERGGRPRDEGQLGDRLGGGWNDLRLLGGGAGGEHEPGGQRERGGRTEAGHGRGLVM
jgi:hypothetical protein